MSYIEKLQRIKAKIEKGQQAAQERAPQDESMQYKVLIEALEGIAKLLSNEHNWIDLPAGDYVPKSVDAPSAENTVERMAWAVHVVGLQVSAFQDLFTQNQQLSEILDSIVMTPITVKTPIRPKRSEVKPESTSSEKVSGTPGLSRQPRTRKFSGSGPHDAHLFSPPGRSPQSQLRASPMDDEVKSSRSSPSSVLKAAAGLTRKISDFDLSGRSNKSEEVEPKQFHLNPMTGGSHERSGSAAGGLESYLGKGRAEARYDPTNKI